MTTDIRREDWESLEPTVFGWGIVDVNYKLRICKELPKEGGKRKRKILWICPYYSDWKDMIMRCHSETYHLKRPTYKGCTICEEWRYLSNFIKWVDSQPNKNWMNCSPDKDILIDGNKHYSPETVVYVTTELNNFFTSSSNIRGDYMLGVQLLSSNTVKPYRARVQNTETTNTEYIGMFHSELEAHKAWQAKKHEYACILADLQDDPRVAKALRERYAPDKDWTNK